DELRAITKNQRSLDNAVMMSSLIPSEKYSCSASPLMLLKGSTAIAGRSGGDAARRGEEASVGTLSAAAGGHCTEPTKRMPLRATVRISRCSSPLSPIALRAALM